MQRFKETLLTATFWTMYLRNAKKRFFETLLQRFKETLLKHFFETLLQRFFETLLQRFWTMYMRNAKNRFFETLLQRFKETLLVRLKNGAATFQRNVTVIRTFLISRLLAIGIQNTVTKEPFLQRFKVRSTK